MVSAKEIASIPLFAALSLDECLRVSQLAADIRLDTGEYAVHAGDPRALFAVLEGRLETLDVVDGVERVVGGRGPGELVGEVPITLATTFPFGFRAAEPTRLVRFDPQVYHAIAAMAPEVAATLGQSARRRIEGLQGIAAEPPPPRAIVYGPQWNTACTELRRFLDRNQVSFHWVKPESPGAAEEWGAQVPADEDCPVIRVVGGKTVVQPKLSRVAELLGLDREPRSTAYDTVVIGAGPAGLAAAVYGASEGLRTIVVEREAPGGQAGTSSRIENYLGFPSGVSGDELASRALQQARRLGAEILVTRSITRIDPSTRRVYLDGGDVLDAATVIIACGVSWRQLPIEGFDRLVGKGVSYGAARSEAPNTHGLDVHIVGAGNSAGQAALFFSTHARSVTILCRGPSLDKSMSRYLVDQIERRPNITGRFGTEVVAVHGERSLQAVDVQTRGSDAVDRLDSGGLFIFIGADAETAWLPPEIALDAKGYVLTGADAAASGRWQLERDPYLLETSAPGIFACGDVRLSPVKRVASAVGEGSMAIAFVHQFLRDQQAAAERSEAQPA
ncbi:MAG TPA: FAD-dependent oxidoreductase [Gaiellales bacterium]|nr:FAD-dependent oxidoreductase [Gaiellales bacterium]